MNINEYLKREKEIHAAWSKLNKAADALESTRARVLLTGALKDLLGSSSGGLAARSGLKAEEEALLSDLQAWEKSGADPGMQSIGKIIPVLWKIVQAEKLDLVMNAPRRSLLIRRLVQGVVAILMIVTTALIIRFACYAGRMAAFDGCRVTYYRGSDFEKKIGVNVEPVLRMGYRKNKAFWYAPSSGWSARWEADLSILEDDEYIFYTQSDDGLRLYIDDQLLVDNWKDQDWKTSGQHAQMKLSKGLHRLKVEHYFKSGKAAILVKWSGGPVPDNSVLAFPYLQKPENSRND
ncbi:MAG: PA14 domain-containing protein [Kiritimatiellia bacterium]